MNAVALTANMRGFIRSITAIVVQVAVPQFLDSIPVLAGELLRGRTTSSDRKRDNHPIHRGKRSSNVQRPVDLNLNVAVWSV